MACSAVSVKPNHLGLGRCSRSPTVQMYSYSPTPQLEDHGHSSELPRPIEQTAPQAIPQPSRSIPQFSSMASSHSSPVEAGLHLPRSPSYTTLYCSRVSFHSSQHHPKYHSSYPSLDSCLGLYLPVVLGCSSVPRTMRQCTNSQLDSTTDTGRQIPLP